MGMEGWGWGLVSTRHSTLASATLAPLEIATATPEEMGMIAPCTFEKRAREGLHVALLGQTEWLVEIEFCGASSGISEAQKSRSLHSRGM